ncbi:MAG: peptidyl-prolyl cis-trans isomerase [Spirochaetaceae bacterium]|jgi:parvulin-like peptidyl-prolyl isomerase|nr:peptidyl-prolyl cis-trans isomerase [Spirochaetaceae bacterium]
MKRLLSICLLFLLIPALGFTQTDLQTIATVNLIRSEPIMVKQLRTETEKIEAGRTLSTEEKRKLRLEILNLMIDEKLILQAAEQERISVTENELNSYFQQIRASITQSLGKRPTDTEFASLIKGQTGMELPAYRDLIRKQLVAQQYLRSKKPGLESSVKAPTEAEILDTYNLYKTQFVQPDTVRFSYIQVPLGGGATAVEKNQARESADRILRDIGSNTAKFDEAVIRGQTQGAGYISEEGRYLPRNPQLLDSVGQNFLNIAFSLPQGAISGVIETPQGFLIIKITGTYEMKTLTLNDVLLQPGPPMTVREQIAGTLTQRRLQEATIKAQEELIAELRARRNAVTVRENFLLSW